MKPKYASSAMIFMVIITAACGRKNSPAFTQEQVQVVVRACLDAGGLVDTISDDDGTPTKVTCRAQGHLNSRIELERLVPRK